MKKLSNWSNILGSQEMSHYKIEDFLFFYLIYKIHIKDLKEIENIFIFEKLEPVERNIIKKLLAAILLDRFTIQPRL